MDWLGLLVSHPWGCLFLGAQELTSLVRGLILSQRIQGEGEISLQDATIDLARQLL